MDCENKWQFVHDLDETYLLGGAFLSEWTTFLVRDADTAYCSGSNLGAILAAQAAIECHLRYEFASYHRRDRLGFYDLIEQSPIDDSLKADLHKLRTYRNQWVHVNDPVLDEELLKRPEYHKLELEEFARFAIEQLRRVIYIEQFT